MKSNKEILKGVIPNLSITFIIIFIIALFALSFKQAAILILTYVLLSGAYKLLKKGYTAKRLYNLIFNILIISFVLAVIDLINTLFGFNPLLSFFLIGFFIAFVVLFTKRKELLDAIRHIEKKHFGGTMEEKKARKEIK